MMIRPLEQADCAACCRIYNHYILETTCTTELDELDVDEFSQRAEAISAQYPYVVCEEDRKVVGFAYLHAHSTRGGYKHTANITIYVDEDYRGKGAGTAMAASLLEAARQRDIHDIIAMIAGNNSASLSFHEKMGFVRVGLLEGIAEKFGEKIDLVYMQYKVKR